MIVVDIETTGLDPDKHAILSIGAIDFDNPENQFYQECRAFGGAEVSEEALEVNGFAKEEVFDESKPLPQQTLHDFFRWCFRLKEKTMAGQNTHFDHSFLKKNAKKYGFTWMFGHRYVDMHSVAVAHHLRTGTPLPIKDQRIQLDTDAILIYTGLPMRRGFHNALEDAKLEAEALSRLLTGKSRVKEFERYPVPMHLRQ